MWNATQNEDKLILTIIDDDNEVTVTTTSTDNENDNACNDNK